MNLNNSLKQYKYLLLKLPWLIKTALVYLIIVIRCWANWHQRKLQPDTICNKTTRLKTRSKEHLPAPRLLKIALTTGCVFRVTELHPQSTWKTKKISTTRLVFQYVYKRIRGNIYLEFVTWYYTAFQPITLTPDIISRQSLPRFMTPRTKNSSYITKSAPAKPKVWVERGARHGYEVIGANEMIITDYPSACKCTIDDFCANECPLRIGRHLLREKHRQTLFVKTSGENPGSGRWHNVR